MTRRLMVAGKRSQPFRRAGIAAFVAVILLGPVGGLHASAAAAPVPGDTNSSSRAYQFDPARGTMVVANSQPFANADDNPPSGNVYCTRTYQRRGCIKQQLTARVVYTGCGVEGGGGEIYIVNPNKVRAPRDITMYRQTEGLAPFVPFFGDRWWAEPGKHTERFQSIPDGTYLVSVSWEDQRPVPLAFGGNTFTVDCGVSAPVATRS